MGRESPTPQDRDLCGFYRPESPETRGIAGLPHCRVTGLAPVVSTTTQQPSPDTPSGQTQIRLAAVIFPKGI